MIPKSGDRFSEKIFLNQRSRAGWRRFIMNWKAAVVVTAGLCVLLPFIVPPYLLTILIEALIFGLFAMSLDLLVGYCRLYSFGHAAAYGLGAYSAALILTQLQLPLPVGIVLAVLVTMVVAVPIAWICTRSTGVSFAMLTLAFAQLGYAMLFRFRDITGGSDGIVGIPRPPGPLGMTWFQGKTGYYYLVLGCLFGSYLLCRAIVRSPFGAVLSGIRENEAKTIALGYNTRAYKTATAVLAYGFGGLAGALYAAFAGFASPELFFWLVSGRVLIMVVVGGAGTLIGPILGGVFFVFVEHELSQVTDLWPLIFGSIFMAFVMFAPEGIWGLLTSRFKGEPELPRAGASGETSDAAA
jgi:branched-chain amino acid transport system permease protein